MQDERAISAGGAPESETPPPEDLICVVFKGRRTEVFWNTIRLALTPGTKVIVEADRGTDLGEVLDLPPPEMIQRRGLRIRRVLRLAGEEEIARQEQLRSEEASSLELVKERVAHFRLPMHVVDAEYQLDHNRVTFYFTAEHRVDFRELVRDLASIFRTRIELRQIGTREAARRLGGIGSCGRDLCCCSFLWDFERVTLQMAREQNLAINPTRLSGICGRLLCCLTFEECPGRPCGQACGGGPEEEDYRSSGPNAGADDSSDPSSA